MSLHTPIILIGMRFARRNLDKYAHLTDRFSEVLHFEPFSTDEMCLFCIN